MTDIEVIEKVLKSNKPTDIFNGDWKATYRSFSRLIHPDACHQPNAADAMAKINYYKDLLENGVKYTDETGDFRFFDKKLVYEVTPENKKQLIKSVEHYKRLRALTDKASVNFHRYLPESMELSKTELVTTLKDRAVPLTSQELPQVHVNWLFSRMFEFSLWLRQNEISHMGLNPTTVLVVPETHGIIVTSFYHMNPLGKRAKTVSAKYKMWYPSTLFTEKIATPDIDLELCKKIALYLLGDRSAAGTILRRNKDVNQDVLNFLLTKHQCDYADYDKYRNILKENFERKFYPLDL